MDTEKETEQAKGIAEYASKVDTIEHIIWSTNEDTRPYYDDLLKKKMEEVESKEGKEEDDDDHYYVPPMVDSEKGYYVGNTDGKGEANQYFPQDKTTFYYTSMYLVSFSKLLSNTFKLLSTKIITSHISSS